MEEEKTTKEYKQGENKLTPLAFHYLNEAKALSSKGVDVYQYLYNLAEQGNINDADIYYISAKLGLK